MEAWGRRPRWLKPADAAERSALRQWLFAVRRGLNPKQLQAYKVSTVLTGSEAIRGTWLTAAGCCQQEP